MFGNKSLAVLLSLFWDVSFLRTRSSDCGSGGHMTIMNPTTGVGFRCYATQMLYKQSGIELLN